MAVEPEGADIMLLQHTGAYTPVCIGSHPCSP